MYLISEHFPTRDLLIHKVLDRVVYHSHIIYLRQYYAVNSSKKRLKKGIITSIQANTLRALHSNNYLISVKSFSNTCSIMLVLPYSCGTRSSSKKKVNIYC